MEKVERSLGLGLVDTASRFLFSEYRLHTRSAFAAENAALWPPLAFVGLDHFSKGRQLGFLWAVLGAAHQGVGAVHEQAMRAVSNVGKM